MPQNTITKIAIGAAAIVAQAKGHTQKLPSLPGHAPDLAPAAAPTPAPAAAPAVFADIDQLQAAPCLSPLGQCVEDKPAVHKALVMSPPPSISRAKHVNGGLRMRGCPTADFTVPVVFGERGAEETLNLVFDTGSGALGVLAQSAKEGSVDPLSGNYTLSPISGPTFKNLPSTHFNGDTVQQNYGSGDWTGLVANNTVSIKGWPKVTMGTGEILVEENMVGHSCDLAGEMPVSQQGILGMDIAGYDQADMGEYWSEVQSDVKDTSFSLALCDFNGTLVQGKPDPGYMASDFVYARYQPGFYGHGIETVGLRVGNQDLLFTNKDFGQTLVDSGSTAVTLPANILASVAEQFALQTGVAAWRDIIAGNLCFDLPAHATRADLDAALPTITLQVRDPDDLSKVNELTFGASNFLLTPLLSMQGGTQACAFIEASSVGNPSTILGNIANVGNWINFGENVGFAKAKDTCEDFA